MPAQGKVNNTRLVDGDVILVQLAPASGKYIPASRASAAGVIPAVVVKNLPAMYGGRMGTRLTVRLYELTDDTLSLTEAVADVMCAPAQTFWWADHFRTWRDRGAPKSVDLSTV